MPNHLWNKLSLFFSLSVAAIATGELFDAEWLAVAGVVGLIGTPLWLLVRARKDGVL